MRRSAALASCAAVPLLLAAPAGAVEPPAPGNLIANRGFDVDTSGWGSSGGALSRTEDGSTCSTANPGAATVTRRTGGVYTISDAAGGNQPTVRSTVAGETFVAYAGVSAASASAAGKPARIILRERVGTTGAIVKETATRFTLPAVGERFVIATSTVAVRSGSTLGLRIEQSGAAAGDAFSIDDVFLRRGTRAFGAASPGSIWTPMGSDVARISTYGALDGSGFPDSATRYLDRLRVYLDGRGGATGTQKLRAVVYYGVGFLEPVFLLRSSREVSIRSGAAGRWVDFRFDSPVRLSGIDGARYQFGLLSGATRNVARFAATRATGALWVSPDSYADGANRWFGTTDRDGATAPAFTTDAKQMSIQGIAAPVGLAHPESCF
jgi:hypothetical protein